MRARQGKRAGLVMVVGGGVSPVLLLIQGLGIQQFSDLGDIGGAAAISEEAIVPDAVLTLREHVDQEATDELVRGERHGRSDLDPRRGSS